MMIYMAVFQSELFAQSSVVLVLCNIGSLKFLLLIFVFFFNKFLFFVSG